MPTITLASMRSARVEATSNFDVAVVAACCASGLAIEHAAAIRLRRQVAGRRVRGGPSPNHFELGDIGNIFEKCCTALASEESREVVAVTCANRAAWRFTEDEAARDD